MQIDNKICFKCGVSQPRTSFYKHPRMNDGLLGKCKNCAKKDTADMIERKKRNPEWVIKEAKRCRDKARKMIPEKECPEKRKKRLQNHRLKYPEKTRARNMVRNAIRDGRLYKKPCERCGQKDDVEAHHDDYSKPLEVIWLCVKHHAERHVEINDQKRAENALKKSIKSRIKVDG